MIRRLAALLLCLAAAGSAGAAVDAPQQVLVLLHLPAAHFRPDSSYSGSYGDAIASAARGRLAAELARSNGLKLVDGWPMPLLGVDCYVMTVPPDQQPEQAARALARDARVEWAQPMNVFRARTQGPLHDDPLYPAQPAAQAWHLKELHALATGRGVRVAVVDSGVEASHPDLTGQVVDDENFVDGSPAAAERHGTAVAGIIAARADNGIGIAGVAPQARLMALRACRQEEPGTTLCTSLALARALHFAVMHGASVINLSLSGPRDRLLAWLLDVAVARGIVLVAAVDRDSADGGFPASHGGVVAVAMADEAPAASGGPTAPGRDVPTTAPGGRWELVSGSSYAAAHVSGLFALLRELGAPGPAAPAASSLALWGSGGIDTCATLARIVGSRACSPAVASARTAPTPP